MELKGRRILISGGTSGIGLATARYCRERGALVFILGQNQDKVSSLITSLDICGGRVCDVRSPSECASSVSSAELAMGGIDTLVLSAGIAPISELSVEDFRDTVEVNLIGAFNLCKIALPMLSKSERADIILLGSRAGRYAFRGGTAYCASKFGIQGLSEALYLDVVSNNIGVTLVAPGTVDTGFAGEPGESWHLQADDVAQAIGGSLVSNARANINWIELRPSRRGMNC
jgi:NAD(P)-dependent dehydrogenase (short-subunit alcohol dehydrogenase family)